jgi:hypothetical protein
MIAMLVIEGIWNLKVCIVRKIGYVVAVHIDQYHLQFFCLSSYDSVKLYCLMRAMNL